MIMNQYEAAHFSFSEPLEVSFDFEFLFVAVTCDHVTSMHVTFREAAEAQSIACTQRTLICSIVAVGETTHRKVFLSLFPVYVPSSAVYVLTFEKIHEAVLALKRREADNSRNWSRGRDSTARGQTKMASSTAPEYIPT